MSYSPYPEYKDTPLDWLTSVPSHWKMGKVKYEAPFQVGWTPPTGQDSNFIGDNQWANISDLKAKVIRQTKTQISDVAIANASMEITPEGSLLYSFKLSVGLVAFAGCDLYTNEAIASFLPNEQMSLSFLYYAAPLFIEKNASQNIYGASILNQELIRNATLIVPCLSEQTHIAAFLDRETAKIDRLIEKQQRLIELLEEKRQAVISHAVTKGLNPDAPMKESGVEWLGQVPEHWSISKLGYHTFKIGSGKTPSGGSMVYQDSGVLFLRSQNIYNDGLRISSDEAVYIDELTHKEMNGTSVLNGDILLNITGGSIGRSCIVRNLKTQANVNQHVCIIRLPEHLNDYISLVIQSDLIQEQINLQQTGGNREGLNFEQIANFVITIPPKDEMTKIGEYINRQIKNFNRLYNRAVKAISLLKERRTALISAAVTGKIDVRDQVPQDVKEAVDS